ncbi:MAG: patatin-like phospholipase family protein, partial [Nostoc sp.]
MTQVKECDLVMKGGITSGIVYPSLVLQLKDKYHFRNIGGTSAGAIAAAATAAAEYGRDTKDSLGKGGFEKLNDLQNELKKGTFLRDLFQPSAATRPLINVLFDLMDIFKSQRKSKIVKFLGLTKSLLVHLPLIFTTGVFLGMCLSYLLITLVGGSVSGWRIIFPILVGCLTALNVSVINLIFILTRKVPENFIGLCSGRKDNLETEDFTVLTDWLNDRLNDIAGIKGRSKPLTFGDLRCKKFDDNRLTADNITLRMVTSNLSQNQPYVLPFKKDLFIFNRQDFAKLFPPQVLNYLISLDLQKRNGVILPKDYYFLPDADDLPVIVATRMSLSFPILLSAVRLYTIK